MRYRDRESLDCVVIGGGVVGAACALALVQQGLKVALVEASEPFINNKLDNENLDLRVFAIAPDNIAFLKSLNVWEKINAERAQPYRSMKVWDAAGGEELVFKTDEIGIESLGYIVENQLLIKHISNALAPAGVRVYTATTVESFEQSEQSVVLRLSNGMRLETRCVAAADGANSAIRQQLGIDTSKVDYAQQGVVAYIKTEHSHENTAWQRFLPTGPLAVLPFINEKSSIVWSLPTEEAQRVLALDESTFNRELTQAFAARLGNMQLDSERAAFPLRLQLATQYLNQRVLLLGDAAHVVHPLAGQGVNLGLRDVVALKNSIQQALSRNVRWDSPTRLQRWARERQSQCAVAAHSFTGINRIFSNEAVLPTLLRGQLFTIANRVQPIKNWLWKRSSAG